MNRLIIIAILLIISISCEKKVIVSKTENSKKIHWLRQCGVSILIKSNETNQLYEIYYTGVDSTKEYDRMLLILDQYIDNEHCIIRIANEVISTISVNIGLDDELLNYQLKKSPFVQEEFCFVVKKKYDSLLKVIYFDKIENKAKEIDIKDDYKIIGALVDNYYNYNDDDVTVSDCNTGLFDVTISFWSKELNFHKYYSGIWDFWMCDHNVKVKYHKELFKLLKTLYQKKVFTETFGFDFEKRHQNKSYYEFEN